MLQNGRAGPRTADRRRQDSENPKVAGLCSEFFKSPELAEGLHKSNPPTEVIQLGLDYEPLLGGALPAELEAADACAEGTELQAWHSDELEQQLASRRENEQAQDEAARLSAARVIERVPMACSDINDQLGDLKIRAYFDALSQYQSATARELSKPSATDFISPDADVDDVAYELVSTCANTAPPEKAAAELRNPSAQKDGDRDKQFRESFQYRVSRHPSLVHGLDDRPRANARADRMGSSESAPCSRDLDPVHRCPRTGADRWLSPASLSELAPSRLLSVQRCLPSLLAIATSWPG